MGELSKKPYELIASCRIVSANDILLLDRVDKNTFATRIKDALWTDIERHIYDNTITLPVNMTRSVDPETGDEQFNMSVCIIDESYLVDLLQYKNMVLDTVNKVTEDE